MSGKAKAPFVLTGFLLDRSEVGAATRRSFMDVRFARHDADGRAEFAIDGLHAIMPGDRLQVFAKHDPDLRIWEGIVDWETDPAALPKGERLRFQRGLSQHVWSLWFREEYPATLIRLDGGVSPVCGTCHRLLSR